jgi:hypothetical protein
MAEAAKLPSDAERAGYIQAHVNIKLDAASKRQPPLHEPRPVVKTDDSDPSKPKKPVDKRADAFNASWGKAS